ncbi:MAG: hypothetical protein ACTHJR_07080 [Sphingomonas sp.]|uniref:hypothetical protein n=1 Tax=Sphingomonas sp. TaxID=28214 RepID=UPI003F7D89B2
MFFISWGSRGALAEVGPGGLRHCTACGKDSWFTKMLAYRVRHVYWLFRWVTDRTPYMICGNCGAAHGAEEGDHNSPEATQAIPKFDRMGWLFGLGGIGALIATGSVAAAAGSAANRSEIAAPQVGDVYEVDLARISSKPEAPVMYSAMRVVKVSGAEVEVELAKGYYNDSRGVDRDMAAGRTSDEAYYATEHLAVPRKALAKMYEEGVLTDVRR